MCSLTRMRQPWILLSLMATGDGRGWWTLSAWEGEVHRAAGLGWGCVPASRGRAVLTCTNFHAGEGEGLVRVVEAKQSILGDAFTHESVNETAVIWMVTQPEFGSVTELVSGVP